MAVREQSSCETEKHLAGVQLLQNIIGFQVFWDVTLRRLVSGS
jgi:hypothetical protein